MQTGELSRMKIPSADAPTRPFPWLSRISVCDALVTLYYVVLLVIGVGLEGPARRSCLLAIVSGLTVHVLTVSVVRSRPTLGVAGALAYRLVVYLGVQLSYFVLRPMLAMTTTPLMDEPLHRLDLALFRVEPSVWLDPLVGPVTTEWFAFFYFSYFVLLAIHVYPIVFFARDAELLAEFMLVMFGVFCVAHCLYFAVPGVGPHRHLASSFQHELPHGHWYDLVLRTVAAGGALVDIFPSLHTAGPTAIAIFSFRHRHQRPFRNTWPFVAFFAANIAVATMFLRWHYAIDVIAGVALAFGATFLAPRIVHWESRHRERRGLSPAWPPTHGRG